MPDETNTCKHSEKAMIVPVPYQVHFVEQVVNAAAPARFLLFGPPGTGKTVSLAALAGEVKRGKGALRCLVIATRGASVPMWQDLLKSLSEADAAVMTPQMYRRLQAETGGNVNVWSEVSCVVASIDFLKAPGRMDEVLAARWDLVVLDDVHHCTESTQRADVARGIWNDPGVAIAVAATAIPNCPEWLAADAGTTKVHWRFADLLGQRTLPQRRIHTINYTPFESERQIAALVHDLRPQITQNQQGQFVSELLLRRLNSSMYALEQTLRRLLTVETFGDTDLNDLSSDDIEEGSDVTAVATSVRIERSAADQILALLHGDPTESKWECCYQLLGSGGIGKTCSGIIFTDYADTAEYLEYLAKSRALNVFLFTGASTVEQRQCALHEARSAPSLLIATGALEGMDFAFTNQVVHYDLPWNPTAFLHRIGRVERFASQFATFDHYYLLERDSTASGVLAHLMEKVQNIEQEWK